MGKYWERIKLPRVIHNCCGYTYDSINNNAENYFKCFAHKSLKEYVSDLQGNLAKVKFCITFWLVCKNNNCITSFTFYYNSSNKMIKETKTNGISYILSLKDKFLDNIKLKIKIPKTEPKNSKYQWRYTDRHPTKNYVSNIYNLDDKKIGETLPQIPKIYKI